MPTVLSLDGAGSGLDADKLDGQDSVSFASAGYVDTLENRITNLENQSGGSQDPVSQIINSAALASDPTCNGTPELEIWLTAARKANTIEGNLIEVDTNGDGVVDVTDMNNTTLAANGVVTQFVAVSVAMDQVSPWNSANPLYVNGGVAANQAACDAVAPANSGQITLCYYPDEVATIQQIFLSVVDNDGTVLYHTSIHGITKGERLDSIRNSLTETLPILEKWVAAGQKAGTPEGSLVEIDSNGDGIISTDDLTNDALAASGIITQFVMARQMMWETSPWYGWNPLWVNGGVVYSQNACDNVAAANLGQITLCYYPAEDQTIQTVFIVATDDTPTIFYRKILYAN